MTRDALIAALAEGIGPAGRVGIDGRCGSGKSMLADELAALIRAQGRQVLQASVDSFHHPAEYRYRQGRRSARGYYEDAFDTSAVCDFVGNAPAETLLIFEGVFLFRRELAALWDYRVFLDVDAHTAIERAVRRNTAESAQQVRDLNTIRYEGAWRIYEDRESPQLRADLIVDNSNIELPAMRAIH